MKVVVVDDGAGGDAQVAGQNVLRKCAARRIVEDEQELLVVFGDEIVVDGDDDVGLRLARANTEQVAAFACGGIVLGASV